jgi:PTH1 family peptidyl-tRNA hydrolase
MIPFFIFVYHSNRAIMTKYLIVGLGNIGAKYENTRHNIGFDVVDQFAIDLDAPFVIERHAHVAKGKFRGKPVVIIKPTTYMNLSGKALKYWMQEEKIAAQNVLVIVDDIAIPFGALRLKKKGGDGSHNGLADIIQQLGHQNFCRLRFGIGDDFRRGFQAEFVLSRFDSNERKELPERIEMANQMIKSFIHSGPELTMTNFNNK